MVPQVTQKLAAISHFTKRNKKSLYWPVICHFLSAISDPSRRATFSITETLQSAVLLSKPLFPQIPSLVIPPGNCQILMTSSFFIQVSFQIPWNSHAGHGLRSSDLVETSHLETRNLHTRKGKWSTHKSTTNWDPILIFSSVYNSFFLV